jgi:autotransporter-associated beta strand protein
LTWAANFFVPSFYALKFGSLKSNATVVFQNPVSLGTGAPTANGVNRNRLIEVTGGVGNAADKTQLTGVISGDAGYDLVKSGTGVLETIAANTYNGNTVVTAGELRIKGGYSGSGAYVVNGGNLLITQSAWNPVTSGAGAVINQGKLVLDYTGTSSPYSTLRPLLNASNATGFASGQFRSALANASVGLGSRDDGSSLFTIQAAYYGDADLNGKVNTIDFNALAGGFGSAGHWTAGNFNYDLIVDSVDFNLLVSNYGKNAPMAGSTLSLGAVVPEPTMLAVPVLLAASLRRRGSSATILLQIPRRS